MRVHFLKRIFLTAVAFTILGGVAGAALAAPKVPVANTQCPVMKKERAREKFFVDYKGQHINFCCKSCIKRFNKNPEKYLAQKVPA